MKPIYENHSLPMLLGLILFFFLSQNLLAQPVGSANLDQVRNGKASDSPPVPVWVNGNAGEQNSHYVEGYSIPYRVVLDGVPAGTEITLTLEFDAKHSGRHAIDYLTHYMRLEPHDIFGHVSEIIDPTDGVAGESGAADQTFPIPPPVGDNSPILGMPATSFNALPAAERLMSIWNGTITNIAYNESPASDLDTLVDKSAQQIFVTFTWGAAGSVILSWGGHIGSRLDWGFDSDGVPNSAGGVSGSPYHMRLIDWESPTVTLTNLGNQDRSLSAAAVITAPDCGIEGVDTVCENSTNTYAALSTDGTAYAWTLADNNTGAMIEGPNSNQTVDVSSGTGPGTFRLVLAVTKTVNDVDLTTTCDTIINVLAGPDAGEDGTATACNSIGAGSTIADLPAALGGVPNGGGSWSDDEATGVDLSDPTMVNFNGVAPGTYDFSYVVLGTPPCDNDTAVVAVTVEICCDLVVVCPDQPADLTCNETMPACVNDVTGFEALGGSVSGACGPVTVECNDNGVVCDGQVVRTLTISDGISSMECVLTYNFTKPIFAVSCSNANEAGCQTQAAIETAFTTWLGSVSSSGACGQAPISTDPAQPAAPDACGGTVQVTFTATDVCGRTATCTASFTVADAPPLSIICPGDPGLAPCTSQNDVDAAFANWLGSASPSGGCGPYTVTTNPTSPAAPDACGGSVEVTFTATDQCGQSATCTANFTVQDASFAMAICPASQSIGMGETQAYIDGQFATWIGTFGTNGEGCNIGVVYKVDGIEVPNLGGTTAPDAFGGQVDVEVIALSSCGNDTCSSSFTVEDTPGELFFTLPAQLTCFNSNIAPADSDLPAAFTQQEVIDR
ncbi:MAG: hypothetical protein OEQ53_13805, partial [Saprospiraceae bacterium]|nr:hypothetical protein [Saprospiraceae bacterium]